MPNVQDLIERLSEGDLRRLLAARRIHAERQAVAGRIEKLRARLAGEQRLLARLDRRLSAVVAQAAGSVAAHAGPRSPSRPARRGSLRSYLGTALEKLGRPAHARELARLALKAGYRTRSAFDTFVRATNQALHVNKEFVRGPDGKYTLQRP